MTLTFQQMCFLVLKVFIIIIFLSPFLESAKGLEEHFDLYSPPQGLAMGDALTADATGYLANYYNPAGLAKWSKKKPEIVVFDAELVANPSGIERILNAKSLGTFQLLNQMRFHPDQYTYFKFSGVPTYTRRNFGISLFVFDQFAALSTDTQVDVVSRTDLGMTVAFAQGLAGNVIKLGVTGKYILRNELLGTFLHTDLEGDSEIDPLSKEGHGFGFDLGAIITLPMKYLPTLGVAWKDCFNTNFMRATLMNRNNSGAPDPIRQTFNAAFSLHPNFGKRLKATFAAEYKHIERTDLPMRKKLHFGFQLDDDKTFYLWAGLYQLYPTFGFAYRVKGGNLEIGTHAVDVGVGEENIVDRRYFMRYTVSF